MKIETIAMFVLWCVTIYWFIKAVVTSALSFWVTYTDSGKLDLMRDILAGKIYRWDWKGAWLIFAIAFGFLASFKGWIVYG